MHVSSSSRGDISLSSLPRNIQFSSLPPWGETDRGRSCAAAAGGGCCPGRCRPAWCPARCGGWAFPSWLGWGLATCPWAWAPASRGESKDRAASGLWSFPCIYGSRLRTLRPPASCRREHRGDGERVTSFIEKTWQSQRRRGHGRDGRTREVKEWLSFLLFLVGRGAPCAQEGPHHHHDDGEGSHRDDDDNDQDVTFTVASHPWFTSRGETLD